MIDFSTRLTKKTFEFGDMVGVFATFDGVTQFILLPKGTEENINDEKICGISPKGCVISLEPTVHIALSGDGYSCDYTSGNTQRNSDTALSLRLTNQQVKQIGNTVKLISTFEKDSLTVNNIIEYIVGTNFITTYNEVTNNGEEVTIESLPSFNISGISPFERYNDTKNIVLHKLISNWSGEGKLYSVSVDKLALEPSWSGLGVREVKWSQTGSMPARKQLPFVAVEDKKFGLCWAVTMQAPCSWIIETVFRNGNISIGGGQGDFLTAHWRKKLISGETLTTRKAYITVTKGNLENACSRLISRCDFLENVKEKEKTLPVIYNEWCSSWGKPCHDELIQVLPQAKALGCKYFVVDDGWFYDKQKYLGDWEVSNTAFPYGLKAFSDKVKENQMDFGIWFEFERVTVGSKLYETHPDWLLTYDGKIIVHQSKAFLDFRKKEVIEYLREKVIKQLKENDIKYLKIDYNDNIGLGVDGAESYGEGLRQHINAVIDFIEELKTAIPDLVLEICASGGMRHEPKFISLADMVSFSDAHECSSGVNIAFNLHRYISPRKLQIWAVIRQEYSVQDVNFTCAKAMLGRFCLSGKLALLSDEVRTTIKKATDYYSTITDIIDKGVTTKIHDDVNSYFNTKGSVYLIRESLDGKEKLVYAFAMEETKSKFNISVGDYKVMSSFNAPSDLMVKDGNLTFTSGNCSQWGCILRLRKEV